MLSFDWIMGSFGLLLADQVHGLFAALLTLPWCQQDQPDVPLLLAPVHFENAALVKLKLEVSDTTKQQKPWPGRPPTTQ